MMLLIPLDSTSQDPRAPTGSIRLHCLAELIAFSTTHDFLPKERNDQPDMAIRETTEAIFMSRLLALGFGIDAALTLDEFALWLNLDAAAYWSSLGRESIDAVVFGALLAIGTWGAPLFQRLDRPRGKSFR